MAIKGPLSGVRILDVSQAHAGPFGSQLLGDLGAEIIKIEAPGTGETMRDIRINGKPYYYLALNRNKKCVTLNFRTETGLEAFYDLVKISDVVFDNLRAGTMERLGIDHETLKEINPRIICSSITGLGSSGPYSQVPTTDDIAQGISGMSSLCGESGKRPMRAPIASADISSGMFAVIGVLTALYNREQTGEGCKVDVNLLDTCFSLMASHYQYYFSSGKVPEPQGSRHPTVAMLGVFQTKNGWCTIGPSWPRITRMIHKEEMMDNPKFSTAEGRVVNRAELNELLENGLREADTEAWVELAKVEDIPLAPVNTLDQAVDHPQVVHNKSIITMYHPLYGEIKGTDCPIKMGNKIEGEHTPPHTLGEDNEYVLKKILGYPEEKIKRLMEEEEESLEDVKIHSRRML
jgi:crotonobetainyl-CoA:carnitine CoA-transferase CaiB-like acyl-CoA transferase